MKKKIDIIIPVSGGSSADLSGISQDIARVKTIDADKCKGIGSTKFLKSVIASTDCQYALVFMSSASLRISTAAVKRFVEIAETCSPSILYSDYEGEKDGKIIPCPVNTYQMGSVRDDFEFGPLVMIRMDVLAEYLFSEEISYNYAGFYSFRLFCAAITEKIQHIREVLYRVVSQSSKTVGERQFDYVDAKNRERQVEMEEAFTYYLVDNGFYLKPGFYRPLNLKSPAMETEASVIIPVRNRCRTIGDAIRSALSQKTSFRFNLIVVDNHSTDGTTEVIDSFKNDARLIHIVPEEDNLGIGGCWNKAICDKRCGRFAIQLDSDDIYSGEDTVQKIVDKFYEENAAMVIGAYRITDFDLNTLPPGYIGHTEWTEINGRNNALRINGLGAPRAFFTPLARKIQFPNTSYGEDYAMGLAISRSYRIGRIYDELYICRRWEGNSDAGIDRERLNRNNGYKDSLRTIEMMARYQMTENDYLEDFIEDQLESWPEAKKRYEQLDSIRTKEFRFRGYLISVQHNPARAVSTGASIDRKAIESRPCFLCHGNRPLAQHPMLLGNGYEVLVNPFPIFQEHLTIPAGHRRQAVLSRIDDMQEMACRFTDYTLFYNGPRSGASAPDHMHFQMTESSELPIVWYARIAMEKNDTKSVLIATSGCAEIRLIKGFAYDFLLISSSSSVSHSPALRKISSLLPKEKDEWEPKMNIFCTYNEKAERIETIVVPRKAHRPKNYSTGEDGIMVSPGAADMAGVIIMPRESDFAKADRNLVRSILREVAWDKGMENELLRRIK